MVLLRDAFRQFVNRLCEKSFYNTFIINIKNCQKNLIFFSYKIFINQYPQRLRAFINFS